MPTKPSSPPGPTSTPHPPSAPSRRPRKLRDAASDGGVMLPQTSTQLSSQPQPQYQPQSAKPDSIGPNRRRRPRKLNKDPSLPSPPATEHQEPQAVGPELEGLESRVRGLEAKVEALYKSGSGGKSPRRRGKGRKGSTSATGGVEVENAEGKAGEETEGVEYAAELKRLEDELESARMELVTLSTRPNHPRSSRTTNKPADDAEDVEEIPRPSIPGSGSGTRPRCSRSNTNTSAGDRSVTLTGSYRIPLPPTVSIDDVRSIQSGISSAQAVARSFLDARRERSNPAPLRRSSRGTSFGGGEAGGGERGDGEGKEGQSWGEWFGAYSVSISRAVKKIEAEVGVEVADTSSTWRPTAGSRRVSAPGIGGNVTRKGPSSTSGAGARAASSKATAVAGGGPDGGANASRGGTAGRPPLKPRASNSSARTPSRVSAEQVKTLMS